MMKKIISVLISLIMLFNISIYKVADAGSYAETVGVENDFGQIAVDNGAGIYVDTVTGMGTDIAKETGNIRLGTLTRYAKNLNIVLGTIDSVKDVKDLVTKKSDHDTWAGTIADKGLQLVSTGMGIAAVVGGAVVLITGAPAAGTVAVVTGTGFMVTKIGVDVTRAVVNTETVKNLEGLYTGKKKIVFAPLTRPDVKEGLDIINEELGFDLYPGLRREIPDPSTGIPVYKPNIYIYCDKDKNYNVLLYPGDYIVKSDPIYDIEKGWNAEVRDGSINGKGDFLFYEAIVPDEGFSKEYGFKVSGKNLKSDMDKILSLYKYNSREKKDFIDFWSIMLSKDKDYIFYIQDTKKVDEIMPIVINPTVKNTYRLWFYIEEYNGQEIKNPTKVESVEDRSDTLVEWGGIIK